MKSPSASSQIAISRSANEPNSKPHNSFHAGLTGLSKRRLFLDRLQQRFERGQNTHEYQHSVLFLDLDGFKVFNETMGHEAGDQVIVEIGRRIEAGPRDQRHYFALSKSARHERYISLPNGRR